MFHKLVLVAFLCFFNCLGEFVVQVESQAGTSYYQIPNPFKTKFNSYCSIKSSQTTVSIDKSTTKVEVDEYFSLSEGLSYSIHRDRDDPSQVFALIADGQSGKFYIIRNPDSNTEIECELDPLHHKRTVFPWQYQYTLNEEENEKNEDGNDQVDTHQKKRKRKNRAKQRFIYGVGAIWLNAIKNNIVSNEVGDDSPYPSSNLWSMQDHDMVIKLLFDKPVQTRSSEVQGGSNLISTSKIGSILVERKHVIDKDLETGATHLIGEETNNIMITSFGFNSNIPDERIRDNFLAQLEVCREHNQGHRIFPSLMKALSTSPQRSFMLEFIVRDYRSSNLLNRERVSDNDDPNNDAGENEVDHNRKVSAIYDETKRRHTWPIEIHTETLSLKTETQVTVYEGLPEVEADLENPNYEKLVDVYIKKFTEKEGARSSRHSTVSYHFIDILGHIESCKVESEPLPKDHLMIRPIHFTRPEGKQLTGKITGLGALILNAADVHYKTFDLFRKEISVPYGQSSMYTNKRVKVNEWQFYDKKTCRTVHFYFLYHKDRSIQHEIKELVRIDIRDAKSHLNGDAIVEKANDDGENDDDDDDDESLIVRYDILGFDTSMSDQDLSYWSEPPEECHNLQPSDDNNSNIDDDSEKSSSVDDDGDFNPDDAYDDMIFADDENKEGGGEDDKFQDEGENFEFEPGKMLETFSFPDFFEFLDGQEAYTIESSISLFSDDDINEGNSKDNRRIILEETVDLDLEWAQLSIFHETSEVDANDVRKLSSIYYINYNSETIFEIDGKQTSCKMVKDVEPWLRLLSHKFNYYMLPDKNLQTDEDKENVPKEKTSKNDNSIGDSVIESNKLPMFGVGALWRLASESIYTDFVGMKRDIITGKQDKSYKYKEVIWSINDDGDTDMELEFSFLWNMTRFELDHSRRRDRRSFEMFTLNSIYVKEFMNGYYETNFDKFKIQPNTIQRLPSNQLKLPNLCHDALEQSNKNEERRRQFFNSHVLSIPSFQEFVKNSKTYSINYIISHVLTQTEAKAREIPVSELQVSEYYDLEENLGKIVIGTGRDTREVFINGKNKEIFCFTTNTNTCKRISTLKTLVDFGAPLSDGSNPEFSLDKMYGLAALWIQLTKMVGIFLRISERHDLNGNKHEVRTYRAYKASGSSITNPVSINILVTFDLKLDKESRKRERYIYNNSKPRLNNEGFLLESIEFAPKRLRGSSGPSLHKTSVRVLSISKDAPQTNKWLLPDECAKLSRQSDANSDKDNTNKGEDSNAPSKPISTDSFPKIMSYIRENDHFYMKSETTISRPLIASDKRLFSLDEWLYNKNIRYTSYGLKKKIDLIIYGQTKESFDISIPFKCSNQLPCLDPYSHVLSSTSTKSNLIQFWNDNTTIIGDLADIYYGPVSLWYLAEKNLNNVQLVTSLDIAPKPIADPKLSNLARELDIETWRVSSPALSSTKWSYDMHFEKVSKLIDGEKSREWHVLQRIELEALDQATGYGRKVEIDVVNYDWSQRGKEDKYLNNFLLPEGYGCKRSAETLVEMEKNYDDLQVTIDSDYWMSYEASLEIIDKSDDDPELGSLTLGKTMLPTLIGLYVRSNSLNFGPFVDIYAHFSRTRYLNGTMTSTKTVYDSFRSLIYQIDRLNGYCKIGSTTMKDLVLEFPQEKGSATVALSDPHFSQLFLRTAERKFQPINRYNRPDGYSISTYELNLPDLRTLNPYSGPISIIRTYSHLIGAKLPTRKDSKQKEKSTKLHDEMSVKVMMFNSLYKLRAILNIKLNKIVNTLATEIIRVINIAECYNDGNVISDKNTKQFVLEYHLDVHPNDWPAFDPSLIAQDFIKNLLKNAKILPTQLDGVPKIAYSRTKGSLEVTFKMIDAPTAIEFFKREPQSTFHQDLSVYAEVKLLPSINECSKWCDHVQCLAMSYCTDRTCRVINDARLINLGLFAYTQIESCVKDQDCDYFYKSVVRSITLENFADSMKLLVNDGHDAKELFDYSIQTSYGLSIIPTKFYEVKSDLETINENLDQLDQDDDRLSDASSNESKTYIVVVQDGMLVMSKLEVYNEQIGKFKTSISHTKGYAACLDICRGQNCATFSYCSNDGSCSVVEGKGDVKQIINITLKVSDETKLCTVSMQDYRDKYIKFENTIEPRSYELALENYSPVECAALCEISDGYQDTKFNCLSFDSCFLKDDPNNRQGFKCFLQRLHVIMDQFDRDIFEPDWKRNNLSQQDKQYLCDHYSKSHLSDFNRVANRKFLRSDTVERGYSEEKCAVSCQQDEECKAFEYCFNEQLQPSQYCYLIRTTKNLNSMPQAQEWAQELEKQLTPSKTCSIYILKHQSELYGLDESRKSLSLIEFSKHLSEKQVGLISSILITLLYAACSIVSGSIFQIVFMKVFGRSVIFSN